MSELILTVTKKKKEKQNKTKTLLDMTMLTFRKCKCCTHPQKSECRCLNGCAYHIQGLAHAGKQLHTQNLTMLQVSLVRGTDTRNKVLTPVASLPLGASHLGDSHHCTFWTRCGTCMPGSAFLASAGSAWPCPWSLQQSLISLWLAIVDHGGTSDESSLHLIPPPPKKKKKRKEKERNPVCCFSPHLSYFQLSLLCILCSNFTVTAHQKHHFMASVQLESCAEDQSGQMNLQRSPQSCYHSSKH